MNIFYINLSTLFICIDVIISKKPVNHGMSISKTPSIKKTRPRTESGVRDVDVKEYPYVVSYEALQSSPSSSPPDSPSASPSVVVDPTRSYKSRHICSGTALSPSSTLTAALCCAAAGETTKTLVTYGDSSSDVLKCTKVVSTWGSSHPLIMSDLALLTTEPVKLPTYGRLSAIDFGTLAGQQVTILGYGLTNDGAARNAQQNSLPLQLIDGMWSKCSDDVVYPVMCVTGTCGSEAQCVKDSGGPVVHSSGIVGVSTLAFTDYKCGQASRLSTIDFIYPVGSTVDMIASIVVNIENKNKHKYFN